MYMPNGPRIYKTIMDRAITKGQQNLYAAGMAVIKVLLSLFRSRAFAVLTTSDPAGRSGSQLLPFDALTIRPFP